MYTGAKLEQFRSTLTLGFQKWVETWNISRPILVEKTPIYFPVVEELDLVVRELTSTPTSGPYAGCPVTFQPAYVLMWRPLCLGCMSRHFMPIAAPADVRAGWTLAQQHQVYDPSLEIDALQRAVELHKWAERCVHRLQLRGPDATPRTCAAAAVYNPRADPRYRARFMHAIVHATCTQIYANGRTRPLLITT
jgi:hypothetical protein